MRRDDDPAWTLARAGQSLQRHPDPQLRELGSLLSEWWRAGAHEPIDRLLGLRAKPGQRSSHTQRILTERDRLVCEAAEEFWPLETRSEQARNLYQNWARYAASAWPRERALDRVPARRVGSVEARLWAIMRVKDHVISERSIRALLAAS